jgi:hypothetical protein
LNDHTVEEKKGKAVDTGAIIINPDGSDEKWETAKTARKLVGYFEARNAEDSAVKKTEAKYNAEEVNDEAVPPVNEVVPVNPPAKKTRKPRAKKVEGSGSYMGADGDTVANMIGGGYSPNNPHHLGSTFAYSPPSLLEGNGYQSCQW